MKNRKALLLLSLGLAAILLLPACGAAAAGDLMAGVKAAEKPASPDEPDAAYLDSVANFTWNLFRESARDPGSVLVSPASVYLALAMTLNGAATTTRMAMLEAMSAANLTLDDLNRASRDWMTLLMNTNSTTRLSIANSIWYRQGFDADLAFLQKNADYFSAGAQALDFNQASAADTINRWVKKSTEGTIEKIVESIDPMVVMYLINAVYFKADWQTVFDADKTSDGLFAGPAGEVAAQFMNRTGSMDYLSNDFGEGVLLPYQDGRFAFMAFLPREGSQPRDLIAAMPVEQLTGLLNGRQSAEVSLSLPKFTSKYEVSLLEGLKNLGMGIAFEPGAADFSLMNTSRAKNLYISEIKHKTFCRVDELGTEAAAVTSVEVSLTSMPFSDVQLVFDRPFIYAIVDTTTGVPLFLGIMENPAE
ncbi:MAG TPA: serine proteinase inhibitor [Clostridiales bacterium]|nr:serine proteinase inhibitor [Clostridiales bacterium]